MTRSPTQSELDASIPRKRDHQHAKRGHEHAHSNIWHILRVPFAAFEFKVAIVARQQAGETDEHLAQGWMYIEVELALEVVAAELAEVGLVPYDNG